VSAGLGRTIAGIWSNDVTFDTSASGIAQFNFSRFGERLLARRSLWLIYYDAARLHTSQSLHGVCHFQTVWGLSNRR
jgi:hypothetical protein